MGSYNLLRPPGLAESAAFLKIGIQGGIGSFSASALLAYMEKFPGRNYQPHHFETFYTAISKLHKNQHPQPREQNRKHDDIRHVRELFLPVFNNISRRVQDMREHVVDVNGWVVGEHYLLIEQTLMTHPGVE